MTTGVGLVFMSFFDDGPIGDADRAAARWLEDRRTPTVNTWTNYGSMLSETLVKVALVALVGGVGFSRAARGMHHPIDVVAGMLMGVGALFVVRGALSKGVEEIDREADSSAGSIVDAGDEWAAGGRGVGSSPGARE